MVKSCVHGMEFADVVRGQMGCRGRVHGEGDKTGGDGKTTVVVCWKLVIVIGKVSFKVAFAPVIGYICGAGQHGQVV